MYQTPLKDERQIKANDVMADQFIGLHLKAAHKTEKVSQRLPLFLLVTFRIDAKDVFTLAHLHAFEFESRYGTNMHCDAEDPPRRSAQRSELVAALLFGRDVFKIPLLLLQTHVAKPEDAFELGSNAVAKFRQREGLDVQGVGARQSRIGALMFAIFFQRDGAVFGNNELRSVLKTLQPASDAPQSGL